MEIQIPLVIFTSFLAWAIGIFGTQCILALRKQGEAIQVVSLFTSVIVLAVGGIAVVFHLTHPFNLFNGFGHTTSGITQELIAIVLVVVVMVLYFLMLRRSGNNTVPAWLAVVGLIACAILAVAMGHSYMMNARPAWNNILQLLSLVGAACVLGPSTVAVIAAVKKTEIASLGLFNVVGACVNAVLTVAFMVAMQVSASAFQSFAYYFDPTHPNHAMASGADVSLFSGSCLAATVIVIIGLVVSLAAAFAAKKQGKNQMVLGSVIMIAGLVCAIALRVCMYAMGETLFMLY